MVTKATAVSSRSPPRSTAGPASWTFGALSLLRLGIVPSFGIGDTRVTTVWPAGAGGDLLIFAGLRSSGSGAAGCGHCLLGEQAVLHGEHRGGGPARGVDLGVDVFHVVAGRL